MTEKQLVEKALFVASLKTCYLQGGFGCRIGKDYYNPNWAWNKDNASIIKKNSNTNPITYGFDCCCLFKGILWQFEGNPNLEYGGSKFKSNGCPDVTVAELKKTYCPILSVDFDNIDAGELVFLGDSHMGIYVGNGEVIESTPAWKCGVQKTLLPSRNSTNYDKLPVRKWDCHGHCTLLDKGVDWEQAFHNLSQRYGMLEQAMFEARNIIDKALGI